MKYLVVLLLLTGCAVQPQQTQVVSNTPVNTSSNITHFDLCNRIFTTTLDLTIELDPYLTKCVNGNHIACGVVGQLITNKDYEKLLDTSMICLKSGNVSLHSPEALKFKAIYPRMMKNLQKLLDSKNV